MKRIEIDDFCKLSFLSSLAFSPEGGAACFAVSTANKEKNRYESNLYIRKNGKIWQLTSGGKSRSFTWKDENTVLFSSDRDESQEPSLTSKYYEISIDGGEARLAHTFPVPVEKLIPLKNGNCLAVATVIPGWEDLYKGDEKAAKKCLKERKENEDYEEVAQNPWWWNGGGFTRGSYSALYTYDAKKKKLTQITPKGMNVSDVKLSEDETAVYYSMMDMSVPVPKYFEGANIYRTHLNSMETEIVVESRPDFAVERYELGETKIFLLASDRKYGMNTDPDFYTLDYGLKSCELAARYGEGIGSSVGADIRLGRGTSVKAHGDALYFISTRFDSAKLYRLEGGKITPVTDQEGSVDGFDISKTGEILTVALYGMRPQEIYDAAGKQLSHFNQKALAGKYVAQPEILNFETAGHEVHGFVLKPFGFEKGKKYPAVLDIHGGPKTVYGPVFYHEMQYWASLGYFVIFCNPTGSDGRGSFMDIREKYGTVDYEDIMAFCDAALAAYPEMDEDNFFETGGSYGGFMTNWIIGHTDGFRACAPQRSISNWFSMCGVSDIGYDFTQDQTGGNIWTAPELMWRQSPLKYARACKTPTLFIHSFEDYRCPIDQGYQMFSALLRNGVESKMVCFKGENHELSRSGKPKHRIKRLNEITQWFEKHRQK